jgi:DNA polymerase-3 subunit alpha
MNYVSLHNHSCASLDGAGTVESLVRRASELDMKALGLTDHGTLAASVEFWQQCQEFEIKPILGMEAYLMYKAKRHHITLLSTSEAGFNNLIYLNNWAHESNHVSGYPLLTLDKLERYRGDLFALSGCAASALYEGSESDGKIYLAELTDAMTPAQVGLEVMFVGTHNTWSRPWAFGKEFNLPHFITNDTHYPCRNQFPAHQAICSARHGFTYDSQHLWLKTGAEIAHEAIKYVDDVYLEDGFRNTREFAERVEPWSMAAKPSLPAVPDVKDALQDALRFALKIDVEMKGEREIRLERLRREFRILYDRQFLDYIYILWDIVKWAKNRGIYVGPGRGSGGGSYVLYLLGITAIDPIHFNLLFERFINLARGDYPDVDVDFEADRRSEVIEYASNKWGTIPIATYYTYSHKSAIHDIARVLHIPKDLELPASEGSSDSEDFQAFLADKSDAHITYQTMLGQIRHRGKHAAGVIIPNRPVPIERTGKDGDLVAAWAEGGNSKDLSRVGIVKYDMLGLSALSMLRRMGELTSMPVSAVEWTLKDSKVYDIFCNGDVSGVFQWSGSEGIRELTRAIAPRSFYDLTTCNALYRPGALDAGTAEQYPHFMKHPRKLHPRIDPLLSKTYGVMCYQEQVMGIVATVMGGDLVQAEVARRLLSKAAHGDLKWEAEIAGLYASFMLKGEAQGFPETLLDQLWHEIYTHSNYSYNLAHATAYTLISYQMAWYKAHFRPEFTVAVLQYDRANAQTYILDAIANGLSVKMPHVHYSSKEYEYRAGSIWLPLTDIDHVGDSAVDAIIAARDEKDFNGYEDFAQRVPKKKCNNRTKMHLERIGAFEGFDGDPSSAIDNYADIPVSGTYQTQLEMLGYVVPTKEMYAKIEALRRKPAKKGYMRFAGFVKEAKLKKSDHGPYVVFNLSPEGSFWIRGEASKEKFPVGAFVSGTKSHFGHSIDVKKYRLDSGE